jgi:hypothetical protein
MLLLSLVGEQPIPNLLVARVLCPRSILWVCSQRTQSIAERLSPLLPPTSQPLPPLVMPPYDVEEAYKALAASLQTHEDGDEIVLNLTGGTKPMTWAALAVAAERSLPFVYLQTEGEHTVLYRYRTQAGRFVLDDRRRIGALINVHDYLQAHGLTEWHVKGGARDPFEKLVEPVLRDACDEVLVNLDFNAFEADFVIRCGNKVGVVECKRGHSRDRRERRAGMDQLVIASEEKYLGTYTARFLFTDHPLSENHAQLAKARNITQVLLFSARRNDYAALSQGDRNEIYSAVRKTLGTKRQ